MASNSREVRTLPGPIENYIARMRNIGNAGLKFTLIRKLSSFFGIITKELFSELSYNPSRLNSVLSHGL